MLNSNGLLALAAAALPLTYAGCYSNGLPFDNLHGGPSSNDLDLDAEVLGDIARVCNRVNNAVFKKGDPPFTDCSNWAVTVEPDDSCYDDCLLTEAVVCDENCGGPVVGSVNRINWEITYTGGDAEKVMTYDMCNKRFSAELGACDNGSESDYDDFNWHIDPNSGACPASSTPEPEPLPTSNPTSTSTSAPEPTANAPSDPSPYPDNPITNEIRYRDYDETSESDKANRKKVHDAFGAWVGVIKDALNSLNDANDKTFDRWFPEKAGDNDAREYVGGVFARLVDPASTTPKSIVSAIINEAKDVNTRCGNPINAYFLGLSGRFHVCQAGLDKPTLPTDISCDDLGDNVSYKMGSLTGTFVHEFLHWNQVGEQAPNSKGHITDVPGAFYPSGAYNLRKGTVSGKTDQDTFINAYNYQWFALNVHYQKACSRSFGDPVVAEGEETVEEGEDVPE